MTGNPFIYAVAFLELCGAFRYAWQGDWRLFFVWGFIAASNAVFAGVKSQ